MYFPFSIIDVLTSQWMELSHVRELIPWNNQDNIYNVQIKHPLHHQLTCVFAMSFYRSLSKTGVCNGKRSGKQDVRGSWKRKKEREERRQRERRRSRSRSRSKRRSRSRDRQRRSRSRSRGRSSRHRSVTLGLILGAEFPTTVKNVSVTVLGHFLFGCLPNTMSWPPGINTILVIPHVYRSLSIDFAQPFHCLGYH